MKAVVAAFNQEKALVGAFSVITDLRMELFQALDLAGGGGYMFVDAGCGLLAAGLARRCWLGVSCAATGRHSPLGSSLRAQGGQTGLTNHPPHPLLHQPPASRSILWKQMQHILSQSNRHQLTHNLKE